MEKAIEALIIQMQKNQKETSSVMEALILEMKDSKTTTKAVDALILQNKKNQSELAKLLKSIEQKKTDIDLSPIKKAIADEGKSIQRAVDELKKKYNDKLKELDKKDSDIEREVADLRSDIIKDLKAIYDRDFPIDKIQTAIKELKLSVEAVKKQIPTPHTAKDIKTLLEELRGENRLSADAIQGIKEYIEKEVDSRSYKPITTGVSTEVKLDGNNLIVNGTTVDLSSLTTNSNSSGSGITWTTASVATQMVAGYGYIANSTSQVELTLPLTADAGDTIEIVGHGTGGWLVLQNPLQHVHDGSSSSTIGIAGGTEAVDQWASITLVAVDDHHWIIVDGRGSIQFVVVSTTFDFMDSTGYEFMDTSDYQFMA